MTSVPVHLSSGGPGPFLRVVPPTQRQDTINESVHIHLCVPPVLVSAHLSLLAYEFCRVKSKSFSRFLLCSLLQASSSPRFSSSPSSSSGLLWVLVGCSEKVCTANCKSRFSSLRKFAFLKGKIVLRGCVCSLTQGLAVSELEVS